MSVQKPEPAEKGLSLFEKYLTVWILLCIAGGIFLGKFAPHLALKLDSMAIYIGEAPVVSIPIAVCLFFMMYPIMVKIEFAEVVKAGKSLKPVSLTLFINWAIKPFTMYALAFFFLGTVFYGLIGPEAKDFVKLPLGTDMQIGANYGAGEVVIHNVRKNAPDTALAQLSCRMYSARYRPLYSYGTGLGTSCPRKRRAHTGYGRDQFASDALALRNPGRIPAGGRPTPCALAGVVAFRSDICSFAAGHRLFYPKIGLLATRGRQWFQEKFLHILTPITIVALLATLVLLFSFKGEIILSNPLTILWIAVPLFLQTVFIFALGYALSRILGLAYEDAAPSAMIGASNHFEVAIATAVMLFGLSSGAALATVVGVLIEVPVMLMLVKICLKTQNWFSYKNRPIISATNVKLD